MFKETPEDVAVKERLWDATVREARGFASRHARGHQRGTRETPEQYDIAFAAKMKGYPMGLIRSLSRAIRRGESENEHLAVYRSAIGLGK